jgi:hypothetical protein
MNNMDYGNHAAVSAGMGIFGAVFALIELAILAVAIASWWKLFTKAGQPGWAAVIPFYSAVVLCKVIGKPGWWWLLLAIPFFNIYVMIIMVHGISKSFGKDVGYTIGLILLGFVFLPMLAFGSSTYVGPALAQGSPMPAVAA